MYLNEYNYISLVSAKYYREDKNYIRNFISILNSFMYHKKIVAEIYGRQKDIYSIWQKMQEKKISFSKIFDIFAIRIIVNCLKDCYNVLYMLHNNFFYLPNEFDDYIIRPKPNGYQSIHTVVLDKYNKFIEIQIRTKNMHKNAELGVAAHWKYKNKNKIQYH